MYVKRRSYYKACWFSDCRIKDSLQYSSNEMKCTIQEHLNGHCRILAPTGLSGAEATKEFVQVRDANTGRGEKSG